MEFISYSKNVLVRATAMQGFIDSFTTGKDYRTNVLKNHGIVLSEKEWFSQQKWLDAFKEVYNKVGKFNVKLIGKAIISTAKFPPIQNLKQAFELLDQAYKMNNIGGEVGSYELLYFNNLEKKAIIKSSTPYPSCFDEGLIEELTRKYKPDNSFRQTVKLDLSKETREKGKDSCTYIINW